MNTLHQGAGAHEIGFSGAGRSAPDFDAADCTLSRHQYHSASRRRIDVSPMADTDAGDGRQGFVRHALAFFADESMRSLAA